MVAVERAPPGLLPVPVDSLAGRAVGQIDEQQLQRVDQLPELPIGKLRLGRDLLQVPGEFLRRHLQQRHGTPRLQEPFNATDIPRAHLLRYAAVGQEIQITVPVGGGTVLAAGVGDGGHHVAVVSVLDRIQSSSVVARSSLVH